MPKPADRYTETTPIVALHGEDDFVLSAVRTHQTIDELVRRGYPARFEAFPHLGHATSPAIRTRVRELIEETVRQLPVAHGAGRS
jgi:predicted esterase